MSWRFFPVSPRPMTEGEVRLSLYRRVGLGLIGLAPIAKGKDEK